MLTTQGKPLLLRYLAGDPGLHLGVAVGSDATPEVEEDVALGGDGSETSAWHMRADRRPWHESGGLIVQATFDAERAGFEWNEYGLFITTSPIIHHHTLQATGDGAVLISRRVPAAPLGAAREPVRVLRVRFELT